MRERFGSSGSSDEGAGDERIGVKAVGSWARYPTESEWFGSRSRESASWFLEFSKANTVGYRCGAYVPCAGHMI